MGIKNLSKFLRNHCEDLYAEKKLSHYKYKKIAVDISLYIFKYKSIIGESWLNGFLLLIKTLREHDVHCVFIYDGKPPVEKEEEQARRVSQQDKLKEKVNNIGYAIDTYESTGEILPILEELCKNRTPLKRLINPTNRSKFDIDYAKAEYNRMSRQIISITKKDIEYSKELFDILDVPYIQANEEAESLAAKLCVLGHVDAVLTEDTDVLAYGCPVFISKINTFSNTCVELRHEEVLESLDMTRDQFTDFCIMCGTDYNPNMRNIGNEKAYTLIKLFKTIEGVQEAKGTGQVKGALDKNIDTSVLKYERAREIFSIPEKLDYTERYCGRPDYDRLYRFITAHRCNVSIDSIKDAFEPKKVILS